MSLSKWQYVVAFLLEHMRAGAAWPGPIDSPFPWRGRFAASLRDNGAILNHGKTFTVSFYQPLVGKVSPSEPWFFYTFTYFDFAVSCTERKAAVDDTKESEHGRQLYLFNCLSASTETLPESRGISFER